jgi:hypothetical protein
LPAGVGCGGHTRTQASGFIEAAADLWRESPPTRQEPEKILRGTQRWCGGADSTEARGLTLAQIEHSSATDSCASISRSRACRCGPGNPLERNRELAADDAAASLGRGNT